MKYAEIEAFLKEREMYDVLKGLHDAVEKEEAFLAELKRRRHDPAMKEEAQDFYAKDITRAMVDGDYLNPRSVLSHRDRYMTAWAIAQLIVAKQRELAPEEETDANTTFVKLCEANAELGLATVEAMQRLDQVTEDLERHKDVMAKIRAAAGLVPNDDVCLVDRVREMVAMQPTAGDIKTLAKHLVWMADTVHQAYHQDPYGLPTPVSWQECTKGTCGSMEHMLAQVGLDKNLNKIKRRP